MKEAKSSKISRKFLVNFDIRRRAEIKESESRDITFVDGGVS